MVVGVSFNSDDLKVCNAYNFNWSPIGIEHKLKKLKEIEFIKFLD